VEFWVVILTVWAFYRWVQSRIRRQKEDERFANVIEALNRLEPRLNDLKKLENRVHELERRLTASAPPHTAEPPVAETPPPPSPKSVELPPPASVPPGPDIPKPAWPAPSFRPSAYPVEPPALGPSVPPPPPKPAVPTQAAPTPHPPAPPHPATPSFALPAKSTPASAREFSSQIEETLGKNWLNKLGIIALVIGISLFLAYKFPSLSNPAKIALGYFVGLLILGTGVYLEQSDRYRVFARALIGGGWALIFFVTYAMHFVPYTRVIDTQWIDLILLFLVAVVMVVHTLRYDSQVVTGLAFLLAFFTVGISLNTIYSLSAGAILALGLVVIVHRRHWFELEVFGILASYINHYIWLHRVIEPLVGRHRMFAEFVPSTVLLCLYWAIYRWSYIERRIQTATEETVSTLGALLNTSLLIGIFKYQSVRPELAFYGLLVLGALELSLGQLPATRRRAAFSILSTIGIILLVAAIPFKYSGMDTAVIWLAEAQMLILAGVFSREILFRGFGLLVALLTSLDMLVNQAIPTLHDRLGQPPRTILDLYSPTIPAPEYQLAISFLVAGLLFYANSLVIPRRSRDLLASENERVFFRALSYLAALMLFVSLWLAFPFTWTAVVWAGAAFLLISFARAFATVDLAYQAHLVAFAAFFRALDVNYHLLSRYAHTALSVRLVTLALVVALFYLCARWLSLDEPSSFTINPSEFYTTAAAILVALVAYRECDWVWIAAAWGAFALVLAVVGRIRDRRDLGVQAHNLVLVGFLRTLLINIDAAHEWHGFTLRFLTLTSMAALLYLCAYFSGPRGSAYARLFSALDTWAGSILIAVLAFKELSSPWIAVAWAAFAFLLLVIGARVKRIELHFQAYLLSASALVQVVAVNLNSTAPCRFFPGVSWRLVTVSLVAALFYLCARWAANGEFALAPLAGATYTWAASSLVVLLMYHEIGSYAIALGWAIFGLLLFEIGVNRKSRNLRAQSYAAFGLSFVRLAFFNPDATSRQLLLATLPIAFIFYGVYFRLLRLTVGRRPAESTVAEQEIHVGSVLAYLGSATLLLFSNSYFYSGSILIAWTALSFLFIAVAWLATLDLFLHHSLLVAFLVFVRAIAFELENGGRPATPGNLSAVFFVSAVAAILFAALAFAFPLRKRIAARSKPTSNSELSLDLPSLLARPEQIYFFLPMLLVTLLILHEVSFGRVTIGWGIEAVIAFLFALAVRERSFRLAGLGLLLICVAKIGLLDAWRLHGSDRYVTLIILGMALLLVSYLYTRYSELIRRYL